MKVLSANVPEDVFEAVEERSKALSIDGKPNRSAYLKMLIANDLSKGSRPIKFPTKDNSTFFVDLCKLITGQKATRRAEEAFESLDIDQCDFLEHVLTRASIAAKWLSKHPDAKYSELRFYHAPRGSSEDQSSLSSESSLIVS